MAATKGSRAKGNKRSGRNPRRGGASRWTQRVHGGLRILQVPELAKLSWLVHGFSTRVGGVSKLDGKRVLNLGFTEWDKRENVKENRRRLQAAVGAQDLKLVSLLQFHSDGILHFETAPTEPARGDASVTKRAGLLLAVQTADCVPILLVGPKHRRVGGVHAKNIFASDLCTACRRDLLFSYRKEGAESGRMMAVIGIRGSRGSEQSRAEVNSRQLKVERKKRQ